MQELWLDKKFSINRLLLAYLVAKFYNKILAVKSTIYPSELKSRNQKLIAHNCVHGWIRITFLVAKNTTPEISWTKYRSSWILALRYSNLLDRTAYANFAKMCYQILLSAVFVQLRLPPKCQKDLSRMKVDRKGVGSHLTPYCSKCINTYLQINSFCPDCN